MAKLSTHYATALRKLAVESGSEDVFLEQANVLHQTLSNAESKRILLHPHIPAAEKQAFFGRVFEGKLHKDLFSFLCLTVDKNREAFLLPALWELILQIETLQRKTRAKVVSAGELTKKQTEALKKLLEKKLDKQVDIAVKVNPSVIGGPYIQVDGFFIDRTVKSRLRDLKERCGA
ncbi:MAG: ATP synthase F1 subunit delta [Oscillospiraceae bacterium]|nr:ATP synthase F1 subunit delta [Oscillospiraceae bacterium]